MINSKNEKKTNSSKSSVSSTGDSSMLKEFFIDEIKDIYWAEKHLVKTLPKNGESDYHTRIKRCNK